MWIDSYYMLVYLVATKGDIKGESDVDPSWSAFAINVLTSNYIQAVLGKATEKTIHWGKPGTKDEHW
jgi:hypothetical protein